MPPSEQIDLIKKLNDTVGRAQPVKPGQAGAATRSASGVWQWMKRSGRWLRALAGALGLAGAIGTGGTEIKIPNPEKPAHVRTVERGKSATGKAAAAGSGPPGGRGPGLSGGTRYVTASEQLKMIQELDELATARPQTPAKPSGPGGGGGGVPPRGGLGRVTGATRGLIKAGGTWVRAVGPQIALTAVMWYLGKKAGAAEARRVKTMLDELNPELDARVAAMAERQTALAKRNPFLPIYANVKLRWVYRLQGGVANDRESTWYIDLLDVELSQTERRTTKRVNQRMDHVWLSVPVASINPVHARLTATFQQVAARYGRGTAEVIAIALLQGMHAERVVKASHWGSGPTKEGALEDKRRYVAAYIEMTAAHESFTGLGAAASSFQATLLEQDQPDEQRPWWMPAAKSQGAAPRDHLIDYIRNLNR